MADFYLDSLSLQEEMPRIGAQARITYLGIQEFLKKHPLPSFKPGAKLLDVGSGPGILTGLIVKDYPDLEVTGIDRSSEMIQFSQLTYPNHKWIQGQAEELPFEDESFSFILVSFLLIHVKDIQKVLKEILRVLKPGGRILLIEPDVFATDADPPILQLIQKHADISVGNKKAIHLAMDFFQKNSIKTIASVDFKVLASGKDAGVPLLNYPNVELGRMTAWSMISHMGQLLNLRDIYNECLELYMRKEIHIRHFIVSVRLLEKI